MKNNILSHFQSKFGNPEIYINAPGRANIIGEHTDYNQGLVLPFAIEQSIHMYLATNNEQKLRLFAVDLDAHIEVDISNLSFSNEGWKRYFVNSIVALELANGVGIDVVFGGNLPSGAGLSSSSAITCGFLSGLNVLFDLKKEKDQLIELASQAENGIGLQGGIMDQSIIIKGSRDHALLIDFLDHSTKRIPLGMKNCTFYIFESGQTHDLVESGYNDRRSTCEKAITLLKSSNSKINSFRDVTIDDIYEILTNEEMIKRCKHVITENKRVENAIAAIQNLQFEKLGKLMQESHLSLSFDYEVSTPQIDFLVQQSLEIPNVLGSRIMGGGFGGSTINLVSGTLDSKELLRLKEVYFNQTGYTLNVFPVRASSGITIEKLEI